MRKGRANGRRAGRRGGPLLLRLHLIIRHFIITIPRLQGIVERVGWEVNIAPWFDGARAVRQR